MPKYKNEKGERVEVKQSNGKRSDDKRLDSPKHLDERSVERTESESAHPIRSGTSNYSQDPSVSNFIKKLVDIDRQIKFVYLKSLKKWDLTVNAYLALESLLNHSQGIEPACLAEDLGIQRQLVTILINDFERRGFILKKENKADHRRKLLSLTKRGACFAHEVHDYIMEMDMRAMSIFSKKEMELMLDFHIRFYDNLLKTGDEALLSTTENTKKRSS